MCFNLTLGTSSNTMAVIVILFNVLIYVTWVGAIDSSPLNQTQPCSVDINEVSFKDFDFQKFAGLWHTIWRSRSHVEEGNLQTDSRHFYMKEDGTMSIVHTTKTGSGGCSMYETTLTAFGNASYIQDSGERSMMTVIETDYHSASLLMYCTRNFQDGNCTDNDQYFEIISRDIKTVPDNELALLSKVDELCSSFEDMVYLAAECQDDSVVIDTIPVLPYFDLHTKNGLSFAIAQSNFTPPNSLTGYNIYLPKINRMIGWFTVELSGNSCSQVMSGLIKQYGKSGSQVYNRLGGLTSPYPWYQWKVLYSDTNYTLAYFCFSDFNGTCPHNAKEVRLDGRVDVIDPDFQKKLYMLLQKVCMSPQNMRDLVYKVDCASVLLDSISSIVEEFEKLKNNRCTLETLLTSRYNKAARQLDGLWYNVAAINSDPGNVLYITTNRGSGLDILTCKPIDNNCKWNTRMRLVQLCDERAEFMQHVIGANLTATPTHLLRMAYIDEMTFFSYECLSESQGFCDDNSLVFRVYSRVPNLSKKVYELLDDFVPFFCLNISQLQTSISFPIAESQTINKTYFPEQSECAVENITSKSNFNQTKIIGYWYEIARSGLEKSVFQNLTSTPHSAVVYFAENDLGQLTFNYFGALEDKCISNIFTGKTLPRCDKQSDGHYFARLHGKSWVFLKILYTDYENLTIMYACSYIYPDGQCASPLLHVLGKKIKYDEDFQTIMEKVPEESCIQGVNWIMQDYKKNCTDFFISEQLIDRHSHELTDHHQVQNDGQQLTNLQSDNKNDTQIDLPSDKVDGQNKQ